MIVSLALTPSLDVTYEVARFEPGGITRPHAVTRVAGGKALNAARVAHRLGARVEAVVALGGRTGEWIADLLAAEGISAHIVEISGPTRMCSAIVEDDGGTSSTDIYEPATPLPAADWARFCDAAMDAVESGCWVALSGAIPTEPGGDAVVILLRRLRTRGARIAVDGSGEGLRATIDVADLVKINLAEANDLLGFTPDAVAAAAGIHRQWGCDVVVTDGVRGGAAVLAGEPLVFAGPERSGRFSAGSGDAFLGGLLSAVDAGSGSFDALRQARDAAERNAMVPGQGVLGEPSR